MIVLYVAVAAYAGWIYRNDYRAWRSGEPNAKAMPGATSAAGVVFAVGVAGALVLLAVETMGEIALGIVGEQSDLVWYAVFALLAAGIVEEVIFRGFLVVENRGRAALVGSCVGFSLLFAVIHPHLWAMEGGFGVTLTKKGWFSTGLLFANSLFFYWLRFSRLNPRRSLFPSMAAHAASNLGVFAVKLAQGHVVG